jgi:aminoglycoside phosphotransferase (APT) family kinase protein
LDRADLRAAARWLFEHPPASAPDVICHGDLHPFNLLVDSDGDVTVLDWSAGLLAPAGYDVAFTSVILAEPPLLVPDVARPAVRVAGRWLSRRFVRAYEQRTGLTVQPATLAWHQGVVCLRALVEVAGWVAAGTVDDRAGHPWLVSGPALASRLSAVVGEPVRAR